MQIHPYLLSQSRPLGGFFLNTPKGIRSLKARILVKQAFWGATMTYALTDLFGASATLVGDVLSFDVTELTDPESVALTAAAVTSNPELAILGLCGLWESAALNDGSNVTDTDKGFLADEATSGTTRVRGTTEQAELSFRLRFYFAVTQTFGASGLA